MQLEPAGREFYNLEITASPAVSGGWEASFDGGTTWVAGTAGTVNGTDVYQWLLAGASADVGTAVATISASVVPLIRATESPELVVRSAPTIVAL